LGQRDHEGRRLKVADAAGSFTEFFVLVFSISAGILLIFPICHGQQSGGQRWDLAPLCRANQFVRMFIFEGMAYDPSPRGRHCLVWQFYTNVEPHGSDSAHWIWTSVTT
jgi:hypothetical protein